MSTMPITGDFIRESLELHLFWARLMKEHAIFEEVGFVCKDGVLIQQAGSYKCQFEDILNEAICLSNGVISDQVLASNELFTDRTLAAEQKMQELTGIPIDTNLTIQEMNLQPAGACGEGIPQVDQNLHECVCALNEKALACVYALYGHIEKIYCEFVERCCIYSHSYPSLFQHFMEEAELYIKLIHNLQSCKIVDPTLQLVELEYFWNHIMKEHSEIIRQMLDPSEENMIGVANIFSNEFKNLEILFQDTEKPRTSLAEITQLSIQATEKIKDFKSESLDLILDCQLKSVIPVLMTDHVLREAYHFLRLLKMPLPKFEGGKG